MPLKLQRTARGNLECRFSSFLFIFYFFMTDLPDGLCPVSPSERQECDYYGITKEQCLAKSCCWDESVPNVKWCFKQPGE